MLHSSMTTKFTQLENRNEELETQIEIKERDFMEERFKREELESEVRRLKEELEDVHTKEAMSVKYGFKDSYLNNAQPQATPIFEQEESVENKSEADVKEYDNIYGKLSSELSNLRNEINNLKSDRSSFSSTKKSKKISGQKTFDLQENQGYNTYFKKNFNNDTKQVLSQKNMNVERTANFQNLKNYNTNFSEFERLNAMEQHLDSPGELDEALRTESESDAVSYRQSEMEVISGEMDPQYLHQSENQSPNQEHYQIQRSAREGNKIYWDIANDMDNNEEGNKAGKMVPNLNMDRIHGKMP